MTSNIPTVISGIIKKLEEGVQILERGSMTIKKEGYGY